MYTHIYSIYQDFPLQMGQFIFSPLNRLNLNLYAISLCNSDLEICEFWEMFAFDSKISHVFHYNKRSGLIKIVEISFLFWGS